MRAPHAARGCALALALLAAGACRAPTDPAPRVRGPLPTRIQQPLALAFPAFRPRSPRTQPQGTLGAGAALSYASLFEDGGDGRARVRFDGETLRAVARARYGLAPDTDVELELAGLYASAGFLDGFVDGFHELLSLPDQGRDDVEDDAYAMQVVSGGATLFELQPHELRLQDTPLYLTHALAQPRAGRWGLALRAVVELPTGDEARGFGNGRVDWGLQALAERSAGRWTHVLGLGWVRTARPERFADAGIDVDDLVQLSYGLECRWSDRLSLLAQLDALSPLVRDIDTEELDAPILDLGLGCAWDLGAGRLHASFHEDVLAAAGHDFGFVVGWTWGL